MMTKCPIQSQEIAMFEKINGDSDTAEESSEEIAEVPISSRSADASRDINHWCVFDV